MQYLKQSTAVTLKIGPFLDDTDGKTAETALAIAQADVRLSKNGSDIAQKTEATSCTHDELGIYGCPVDDTDTATLGRLQLWVHESGALPIWHEYTVLPANVYDSMFSTDKLEVDILQIGGVAQSATDLKDFADAGYDPATHKVQGMVLVDTVTALTGHTAQTGDSFARLGAPAAASIAADLLAIDNFVDEIESRLTAARAGYLDNLSAGAVALASALTTHDGKLDTVDGIVDAILLDTGTDGVVVAAASKTGYALSAAGVDAIIDEVVEGTLTLRQMLRILKAATAGKSAGGGTATLTFRDVADSKNRISATVDANGNRTAITVDGA